MCTLSRKTRLINAVEVILNMKICLVALSVQVLMFFLCNNLTSKEDTRKRREQCKKRKAVAGKNEKNSLAELRKALECLCLCYV